MTTPPPPAPRPDEETVMSPVPEDAPLMVAWKSYCASEDYANSFKWAAQEQHRKGSMWAAFMAGFAAAATPHAPHAPRPDESGIDWRRAEVTATQDCARPEIQRYVIYAVQARPYIAHLEAEVARLERENARMRATAADLFNATAREHAAKIEEAAHEAFMAIHKHVGKILSPPPVAEGQAREGQRATFDYMAEGARGVWRCENCGEMPDGNGGGGEWRYGELPNGKPEHRCAGLIPQAGYFPARFFPHRPRYRVEQPEPGRTVVTCENMPEGLPVAEPVAPAPAPAGDEEKWAAFFTALAERSWFDDSSSTLHLPLDAAQAIARAHLEPKRPRVTREQVREALLGAGPITFTVEMRVLNVLASLGLLDEEPAR